MEANELFRTLHRVISGDLSAFEFRHLAQREGYSSFSDLCEHALPIELKDIRIRSTDLLRRLDAYRRGLIELKELWAWAEELHRISFNHRLAYDPESEDLIVDALSALRVVCNQDIFPRRRQTRKDLGYVWRCLREGRPLILRRIFSGLFKGLQEAHLATLGADAIEDVEVNFQWADVVIMDRPFHPLRNLVDEVSWVMAFTVTTRSLFEEELLHDEVTAIPEIDDNGVGPMPTPASTQKADPWASDRVPALRRLVPNFDTSRYRPHFFLDAEGITEIVLDAEVILEAEIRYAAKLFCLANGIGRCHVNGGRIKTLQVAPVVG